MRFRTMDETVADMLVDFTAREWLLLGNVELIMLECLISSKISQSSLLRSRVYHELVGLLEIPPHISRLTWQHGFALFRPELETTGSSRGGRSITITGHQ